MTLLRVRTASDVGLLGVVNQVVPPNSICSQRSHRMLSPSTFTVYFLHGGALPAFKALKRAVVLTMGSYSVSLSATEWLSACVSLPIGPLSIPS